MKYLIFGNGFLGNKFKDFLGDEAILIKSRINTIENIEHCISEFYPEIIINCIGKTGRPNIDWCEDHKEATFFSNVTVPTMIAEVCNKENIYMVHIGSGCIYEDWTYGNTGEEKGWSENDKPNFFGSFYSRTKIYSEQILSSYDNILQIRIRMPIDNRPSPRNLIDKLIGYKNVIGDELNSVTCIPDLMRISKELMKKRDTGIYNVVQTGNITHKRILTLYKLIVDPEFTMPTFINVHELSKITKTGRSNCILSTDKLSRNNIYIQNAEDAVKECLIGYKKDKKEV